MSSGLDRSRLAVLLFTDLVGSTELKAKLGAAAFVRLLGRHDALFKQYLAESPGAEVLQDTGDGYFAAFARVSDAVNFALKFQESMRREGWDSEPLRARLGIHVGEVAQVTIGQEGGSKLVGLAADIAARVMSLAAGGQVLLTRAAFDDARQFVREFRLAGEAPVALRWVAHGEYLFKGAEEPLEVFEVGLEGISPLSAPCDNEKARRSVSAEQEETLGWRPAVGLEVPQRATWHLEKKLGEGTFGEVWLARSERTKSHRVFKFCFDVERLRSFKRELTLFRLLRDALGDRKDIARLYDVRLDHPPFFLESEFAQGGNLADWATSQGGIDRVSLASRLEIVAKVADAVSAAHSVGVLHKDIKPSNILIHIEPGGAIQPRLSDFGIGTLLDRAQLSGRNITEAGFTMLTQPESSRSGTRIYTPPESLAGKPFTTQGDIYALGIFLYQMVVAELTCPLAVGWERQVQDELLREDISRCVEGDPTQRLSSSAELAQRIRSLPQRRMRKQFERRRRYFVRFAVATLVAMVLLSSMGAVGYFRERGLRQRALAAEQFANEQRTLADQQRRRAELLLADSTVESAVQLDAAGGVVAAWASLEKARRQYGELGLSPLPADLALCESYDAHPPPLRVIDAHNDAVFCVAASADGRRLITGSKDRTLKVWEMPSGRAVRTITGHNAWILGVDISPDGKRAITAGSVAKLWDLETGREVHTFGDAGQKPLVVRFLPGATRAISGGEDMVVRLWDLDTGKLLRVFPNSNGIIRGLTVTPDAKQLIVGSDANGRAALKVWDVDSGQPLWTGESAGSSHGIRCLAMFPDGCHVAAANNAGVLEVWDLKKRAAQPLSEPRAGLIAVAVSPDGKFVLAGSSNSDLRLVDSETGAIQQSFFGSTASLRSVTVLAGARVVVGVGLDGKVRFWGRTGSETAKTSFPSRAHPRAVFAIDNRVTIALADDDPVTTIWDNPTAKLLAVVRHDNPLIEQILPQGRHLGSLAVRRTGDAYQALDREGRVAWELMDPATIDDWLDILPDKTLILFRHKDFGFSVWDYRAGKRIGVMLGHGGRAGARLVPDGKRVLSLGTDKTLRLWDIGGGAQLYRIELANQSYGTEFSGDARVAATVDVAGTLRLWEVDTGRELHTLAGHTKQVTQYRFSPDGRYLISRGDDNTVRIWDVATGRQLHKFTSATPIIDHEAGFHGEFTQMLIVRDLTAGRRELKWWSVDRSARYRDFEVRLAAASGLLQGTTAERARALETYGEWYAFRGMDPWSVELLEAARAAGETVSSVTLGRCLWKMDRLSEAAAEFHLAIERKEAPENYLRLCLNAIERPPQLPTTFPTISPATMTAGLPSTMPATLPSPILNPALSRLQATNVEAWKLRVEGKLDQAETLRRGVVDETAKLLPPDDPRLIKYRIGYGEVLAQLKRYDEAESQYRAIERASAALPDTSPQKVDLNEHFVRLYTEWSKTQEATRYEAKLSATRPAPNTVKTD